MLQESPDEFENIQGRGFEVVCLPVLVGKGDCSVGEAQDVSIRDSDAMDVGCQVFQGGLTGADGLDMRNPVLFPNTLRNLVIQSGFFATIPELGAYEDGQWFDVHQKVVFCLDALFPVIG
jgi:hypothetical protein